MRAFDRQTIDQNDLAAAKSGMTFTSHIEDLPSAKVLGEIEAEVNMQHLEETLMSEGIKKFADPQKALLALIAAAKRFGLFVLVECFLLPFPLL